MQPRNPALWRLAVALPVLALAGAGALALLWAWDVANWASATPGDDDTDDCPNTPECVRRGCV